MASEVKRFFDHQHYGFQWKSQKTLIDFYFLFTIVMKVLISCTENPKKFIEVLDELELFIDKKVIFDKKNFRRSAAAVCRLSTNFVIRITFFPFNLDTSPFQVKVL
jgi:hypothetical protein